VFTALALALGAAGYLLLTGGADDPPPEAAPGATLGRFAREEFHLDRDLFLPATDPRTVEGARAGFLAPKDEVFGVVVKEHARAYPVFMIAYHHVVNDVIEGVPVAITY
jgi:hypothetical protein